MTKCWGSLILVCMVIALRAQPVHFPLKSSENRRYFVDAANRPFLYNADTGWQLFYKLTTEEARAYLLARKDQGFNTIQVMLSFNIGDTDRYGNRIFMDTEDFTRPNQAYHDHVLKIIRLADSLNMLVVMSQPWLGCCEESYGGRPDKPLQKNGPRKSRWYGNYLGKQFSECKNLFWIIGGDNDPKGDYAEILAFAEGLRGKVPAYQLLTYHASSSHSSTDLFQYAPWLGFSMVYTYWRNKPDAWVDRDAMPEVYEACLREYKKSDVMPFVLGESQYEGFGRLYPNDIGTPAQVRRQAYWTILCGGAGHAYGSDGWSFLPTWKEQLKYTGANQLRYFYQFFTSFPWYNLQPDRQQHFLVAGNTRYSDPMYVTAALTPDGKYAALYFPERRTVVMDLSKMKGNTSRIRWFNPRTGKFTEETRYENKRELFTPPGEEDWALLIEAI